MEKQLRTGWNFRVFLSSLVDTTSELVGNCHLWGDWITIPILQMEKMSLLIIKSHAFEPKTGVFPNTALPSLSGRSPPTWPNAKSGTTLGGVGLNSFFPLSGILPSEELIFRINQKAESFPTGSLCIPDPLNFPKLGHWDCQWLEELADTPTSTGVQ